MNEQIKNPKPIPVWIQLWLKALRSGDYKQGRAYLRDSRDRYCCLGVLCEIQGVHKELKESEIAPERNVYHYDNVYCSLPDSLKEKLNLYSGNGSFRRSAMEHLAGLNDRGVSFNDIADIIENNWEYLLNA